MKPINQQYHNLDSTIEASYVDWDMADEDDNIVVSALSTSGDMNTTEEQLNEMINRVIEEYQA